MTLASSKMKTVVFLCAAVLIAASLVGATIVTHKRGVSPQTRERHPVTDTLPQIIHKVKDLKIVKATIENQGQPGATAILEIKNTSDKAVTAYNITFGSVSVGQDGGLDSDEPMVLIEPQKTTTLRIPVSNLDTNLPIILAAVMYADGTEDGQDVVLEMRHDLRKQAKAERDAKNKGGLN